VDECDMVYLKLEQQYSIQE